MAQVTPGRPKSGRHPAMWQSVPMESFIQPHISQHLVSKDYGENSGSPNRNKKDTSGTKYDPPKKKDPCNYRNNNRPLRSGSVEDKGSNNNQICQKRGNLHVLSSQRNHTNFSKSSHNASFHAPSQNLFLSNEDDFPSLCSSNSSKVTEAAAAVQETCLPASTSYSEKLKFIHHIAQQDRVEANNVSIEKEIPSTNHPRNSFNHSLPKHDKKRNCSTTTSYQDRINWQSTPIGSRNMGDINQWGASPIQKTRCENQRDKICSQVNVEANCSVPEIGDNEKNYSSLSKTHGNTPSNSFNARLRNSGEQSKSDLSSDRYTESVRADLRKDFSSSLKSESKRLVMGELKEKCLSSEVPNNCENVPNVRGVGKMKTSIKNNAPKPSKMVPKYIATADEKEKSTSSDLTSNQESARYSQQGTCTKTSKKRKNRKSKLKRNLAFQTGKITILTPELYSRFTGNPASSHNRSAQSFSFDLSDMEEYPKLGQVKSLSSDHNKKMTQAEVLDSSRNSECDPASNSADGTPKQLLFSDETASEETNTSQNANMQKSSAETVVKSEQSIQNITDGTVETIGGVTGKKPGSLSRKRAAVLESERNSANEQKESPLVPEQKAKIRHDGSIQISFSDILSSSMVKVKSETSKSRKQNDSRIKVISSKKVKMDKNLHIPPNSLDSSRPGVKRGKERERPKPKKHTALKRIILKERSEKKLKRNLSVQPENMKNEVLCQKMEECDIPSADKEGETETEADAEDPSDSLCNYLTIECASEYCEVAKDERLDENLQGPTISVKESLSEKKETRDLSYEEKKIQAIQIAVHTRHFREYCNHLLSAEIDQVTLSLLGDLTRFQDRLHQKDPVKARIKRRLVYGIKEVTKHLKLKKVKCVILAPDSENIKSKGGLNDAVSEIVRVSAEYHIPCVFALRRKTLGKACLKPVPVACVGIFNYDGSEANLKKLIELQAESKKAYDAVMTNLKEQIGEEDVKQLIETQENSPRSLQDLRITILRETLLEKNPDLHLVFTPSGNVQLGRKEE